MSVSDLKSNSCFQIKFQLTSTADSVRIVLFNSITFCAGQYTMAIQATTEMCFYCFDVLESHLETKQLPEPPSTIEGTHAYVNDHISKLFIILRKLSIIQISV